MCTIIRYYNPKNIVMTSTPLPKSYFKAPYWYISKIQEGKETKSNWKTKSLIYQFEQKPQAYIDTRPSYTTRWGVLFKFSSLQTEATKKKKKRFI